MKCTESSKLVRYLFLFLLTSVFLLANDTQKETNTTIVDPNELIKIEDTSGLSEDELRQVAKKIDKKEQKKKSQKKVRWEDLSPTPMKSDWVETKSGEWFRGEIKGLYDDKLEFDSDEIGLHTFDFDDIKAIRSYQVISVNVENLASISGILRLDSDKVSIIQGQEKYEFKKSDIVSFAPDAKLEKNIGQEKLRLILICEEEIVISLIMVHRQI